MATYADIEIKRFAGKTKYVNYPFDKVDPSYPNKFDIDNVDCCYIEPGSIRHKMLMEAKNKHNMFVDDKQNFTRLEQALKNRQCPENLIDAFKRLTTINHSVDKKTCALMIYAGGSIDFDVLIRDVNDTKNPLDKIVRDLAEQVNCGALNGMYASILSSIVAANGTQQEKERAYVFAKNVYKSLTIGTSKYKAIEIPNDPYKPFELVAKLSSTMAPYSKDPTMYDASQIATTQAKLVTTQLGRTI